MRSFQSGRQIASFLWNFDKGKLHTTDTTSMTVRKNELYELFLHNQRPCVNNLCVEDKNVKNSVIKRHLCRHTEEVFKSKSFYLIPKNCRLKGSVSKDSCRNGMFTETDANPRGADNQINNSPLFETFNVNDWQQIDNGCTVCGNGVCLNCNENRQHFEPNERLLWPLLCAYDRITDIPKRKRTIPTAAPRHRKESWNLLKQTGLPSVVSHRSLSSVCVRTIDHVKSLSKGANCIYARHQSSSPLAGSSSQQSADDMGQPWTILGARDYGKSIPVLNQPITVTTADIKQYLNSNNLKFDLGHTCFVTCCPRLNKRKAKLEEADKLYINMTTGSFVCHSCKKFGAWGQFQDNVSVWKGVRRKKDSDCFPELSSNYNTSPSAPMTTLWESSLPLSYSDEDLDNLLHTLGIQDLSLKVLRSYGVRLDQTKDALLIPIYFVDNCIHGVKKISVRLGEDGTNKGIKESIIPRGEMYGLIGWNTIVSTTDEVVLTASEFDAMAVFQETKVPAIALPKGDSVLPQEILPLLEQFKKIVLWFKNDIRSWEVAKHFTKKLNEKRCYVIRPSSEHPNALTALQNKTHLTKILEHARSVSHQSITAFSQLRQEVFSELAHVEQVAGVKWRRYPHLNKLLKGHRRGELTIFTGPTGSGKTTFISDYSLDLCMQGVNTLWGSFEINNVRLMKMMLTQFAQQNISKNLKTFDHYADQFEMLPMYFMTFFGQESIKKVIETMSHAVYIHDIAHVIVDNLQFMMGVGNEKYVVDKYQRQDQIVAAFRTFATTMNCHVTVVVHPRKEKDNDELTTASVYGSAKATQEADNVMILQDKRLMSIRGKKYLQIAKNRFDGELGVMLLKFDKETLSFAVKPQKSKEEIDETENVQDTVNRWNDY